MTTHDLRVETPSGTALVTITPLAGDDADSLAGGIAALLKAEYGEAVIET